MKDQFASGMLNDMVDRDHMLVQLASQVQWGAIEKALAMASDLAFDRGAEDNDSSRVRLLVGMVCLKAMLDTSWEAILSRWPEEVHWQFFCGLRWYRPLTPCTVDELCWFEEVVQRSGMEPLINLAISLACHPQRMHLE